MYQYTMFNQKKFGFSYFHNYVVYYYTSEYLMPYEAYDLAKKLVEKFFGREEEFATVGIEKIPFQTENSYVVCNFREGGIDFHKNTEKEFEEKLEKYRRSILTIDCDLHISKYDLFLLYELIDDFGNVKLAKTHSGFHARIELRKEMDFEEMIELRKKYGDDLDRVVIDKKMKENGLAFLTNYLFNEKHWRDGEINLSYKEEEITADQLPDAETYYYLNRFYPLELKLPRGTVKLEKDGKITFKGKFRLKDIEKIIEDVKGAPLTKTEIVEEYRKILKRDAESLIEKIEAKDNLVLIYPKPGATGLLIGKGGKNVKYIQEKFGQRIKIITGNEDMIRRSNELLKSFLDDL